MARDFDIPFIGIYEACATSGEGIILASTFIESKMAKRVIVSTSSHNMASENNLEIQLNMVLQNQKQQPLQLLSRKSIT